MYAHWQSSGLGSAQHSSYLPVACTLGRSRIGPEQPKRKGGLFRTIYPNSDVLDVGEAGEGGFQRVLASTLTGVFPTSDMTFQRSGSEQVVWGRDPVMIATTATKRKDVDQARQSQGSAFPIVPNHHPWASAWRIFPPLTKGCCTPLSPLPSQLQHL